jgi:[FeFe] hydrogenase H-cluster maturation GTPase HydF
MMKNQKPHIGIFGKRNAGKSSLINVIAGQDVAIVDSYAGTTTDPVSKSFEITGLGPVIMIDTAGIDDTGSVGDKRVKATFNKIKHIDMAVLVVTSNSWGDFEDKLIDEFEKFNLPFIVVHNKSDENPLTADFSDFVKKEYRSDIIAFSAKNPENYENLIDLIRKTMPDSVYNNPSLIGDLVSYGSKVLLITPIDVQAPAGRLILPQVQVIRDCLDNDCITTIIKEREIDAWKASGMPKPDLVITDSQVFLKADASFDDSIPLTSFSIVLARYKGPFDAYLQGTPQIDNLKDGDKVLILESCSHHVAGDDIGRVKIPRWLRNYTGCKLDVDVVAGLNNPPSPLTEYGLVIQCGGCMLTRKQLINRLAPAIEAGIPVTNYGLAIAYCLGIYQRAVKVFSDETSSSAYL